MSERESTEIEFDFFEEPATSEAARPERALRRPRRPRRPSGPPSGLTPLLRLVGLISLAILVVVLLVFWVSSCRGEAKRDTYRNYMTSAAQIADASEKIGTQLNSALIRPDIRQADLVRRLDGLAQQQVQLADRAEGLDKPGPLRDEHREMVEALQFRVSGLRGIGNVFRRNTRNASQA